jgi:tRNA uridine 5-carboxymethylaminomethyl modification enzyme
MIKNYDVIVIGAGHAGIEASTAAARIGTNVLLLTQKQSDFGKLSCNPAIGGIGKGTIIKEIDALDGCIAKLADKSAIHKKILNSAKGPAVHGPRCQVDINLYPKFTYEMISNYKNITIHYALASKILTEDDKIIGIEDESGNIFNCKSLIITTGTFLGGMIIRGEERIQAGRIGDEASVSLSKSLRSLNFDIKRLKTGTPPRVNINSINFENLEKQKSDIEMPPMSFMNQYEKNYQNNENLDCYITHTNENGHNIIQENKNSIPTLNGDISVKGPRYCPSIEDKVRRFTEKTSHQIFLEKQSLTEISVYPNGMSTSMSKELQEKFFRTIKGFENIKILEYGYAIEYDFINPQEMQATLETKKIKGLFLAGQIIGTTGYEEAAGLGIVAGINAGLKAKNKKEFILERCNSFIGVMIEDLITKGIDGEPYRMFTSRSEYRISCRPDNADLRLTELGHKIGIVSKERYKKFKEKESEINKISTILNNIELTPHEIREKLKIEVKLDGIKRNLSQIMHSMKLRLEDFIDFIKIENISQDAIDAINNDIYYLSDINRQKASINDMRNKRNNIIPLNVDYSQIKTLSKEVLEKLNKVNPRTISQLERISGITPAAVFSILHFISKIKN